MDIQLWPNRPESADRIEDPGPPPWRVVFTALMAGLLVMGATGATAFLAESLQEEVWLARAEVEYRGNSLVETIAVAMNSPGVWGPIAIQNDISIKEFQKHYRAEVVGGTQALGVEFEDPDPVLAQKVVSEVIESFLVQFAVVDDSAQNETLEDYLDNLLATESDLLELLDDTDNLTRNEQIDRRNELIAVRQAKTQIFLRLDGRFTDLEILDEQQPRVISDPYVLPKPIEPEPVKMAVVGVGAGGLLAVSMAFVLFHRDENQRRRELEEEEENDWGLAA